MAFWKWGKKAEQNSMPSITDASKAWESASSAMIFYMDYREKYNLPFTSRRWRDDFALGFRDGICQLHFTIINNANIPNLADLSLRWKQEVVGNDETIDEAWARVLFEDGYTERGDLGFETALLLESWRLNRDFIKGGLEYISNHKIEYINKYPDATKFNIDHDLVMTHFVVPLIWSEKIIHPYLLSS